MRDAYDALKPDGSSSASAATTSTPASRSSWRSTATLFPGNPQNLDELLQQLAERMAAAQGGVELHEPRGSRRSCAI